eukprot:690953-Pelagomonas_calceolata.AAC.7
MCVPSCVCALFAASYCCNDKLLASFDNTLWPVGVPSCLMLGWQQQLNPFHGQLHAAPYRLCGHLLPACQQMLQSLSINVHPCTNEANKSAADHALQDMQVGAKHVWKEFNGCLDSGYGPLFRADYAVMKDISNGMITALHTSSDHTHAAALLTIESSPGVDMQHTQGCVPHDCLGALSFPFHTH